uniref:Major facilitator superfamily (MFS) profile domain-containing protein n=1 Tax=Ciona savignyi TaxID=51511 RepID=H2YDQ3_CIOSA
MTYTGFGISLAALNPSTPAVVDFINGTYLTRYSVPVPSDAQLLIISLAQSMVLVGAIIGAGGVRFFIDMFSRKFNILCVHLLVLLSTILMGPVPKATGSYEVLIVGRLLNGISRGVAYTCVPIYIAETCNRKSLPLYQAPSVLLIFGGILIANCIGHPKVLGGVYTWPYLLASPGIFSVLYVISYPFLPNTPVYILRYRKSEDRSAEALNVLQKLRRTSSEKTKKELATLKKEIEGDIKLEKVGLLDVIRDPHYRIQLLAAVIVMLTFPMSGVDGIIMY